MDARTLKMIQAAAKDFASFLARHPLMPQRRTGRGDTTDTNDGGHDNDDE